jgi:hypothetical protein
MANNRSIYFGVIHKEIFVGFVSGSTKDECIEKIRIKDPEFRIYGQEILIF